MKRVLAIGGLVVAALAIGWWGRGLMPMTHEAPAQGDHAATSQDTPCPGGAAPLYWKAPMDPSYVRNAPGKSPMGMDLVPECPPRGGGDDTAAPGTVRIDPQTVQNIGVRTARVERSDLRRKIRAVGRVAYDERRVEHVHTKVQGWVERLRVDYVGQRVRRGQPLLEIYSPELVATQEELLLAARYRSDTEDSPFAEVRGGGESLYAATRRRLELWDIRERDIERLLDTGKIQKTLTLYAPTSGVVTKLGVRSGMEVAPNHNLYTIADLSSVWVVADVYEEELPWLALGQQGSVELTSLPGQAFSGPVTYIAPFLDPKTRTAQVRLELPNAEGHLRPEMFGNTIIEGTPVPEVVAIPTEAVIRSGRRSLVVVALGEGRFSARQVTLGLDDGEGQIEVREGLAPGDEIVVSSQFLIDSESRLQEAVQSLLSAGEPQPEPGAEPAPPAPMDPTDAMDSMDAMDHDMHEGHTMPPDPHEGHAMPHGTHE